MSTATERIAVLVTTDEKSEIAKKAKDAGLSMGEFLRRAAATFNPSDDNALIEGMIDQMVKTTQAANIALDDAFAYIEQSNKRIAVMESQRSAKIP